MIYVWQVLCTQKILSFLGKISLDSINKKLDTVKKDSEFEHGYNSSVIESMK